MSGTICFECHAAVSEVQGPVHEHVRSSPGCWELFGAVLAREYTDFRYGRAHGLTVDAYSVQHPGTPSPQSIASVGLHLMRLHWVLEQGYESQAAVRAMKRAAEHKKELTWLEPPTSPGAITVRDVHDAQTPEEHVERVRAWAAEVWRAWSAHHATVRRWAHEYGQEKRRSA